MAPPGCGHNPPPPPPASPRQHALATVFDHGEFFIDEPSERFDGLDEMSEGFELKELVGGGGVLKVKPGETPSATVQTPSVTVQTPSAPPSSAASIDESVGEA